MIQILIADDHALIREGLKKILKNAPDMTVVGEAKDAAEALNEIRNRKPDLVILDISLPGKSGLELLDELRIECPQLRVLILSMHPEDRFAVRALKAGASGYVTKDSAVEELIQAIRKVIRGRKYVSNNLAEKLALEVGERSSRLPHEKLSSREHQILCMIVVGTSVGEISQLLSISKSTVSTYRTRILNKMNMKTDAELIRYAVQNGIVD